MHKVVVPGEASRCRTLHPPLRPGRYPPRCAQARELGVEAKNDRNTQAGPAVKVHGSKEPWPCRGRLLIASHCAKVHVNSMPARPVHGRSPSARPFKLAFQGCRQQHNKPSRIAEMHEYPRGPAPPCDASLTIARPGLNVHCRGLFSCGHVRRWVGATYPSCSTFSAPISPLGLHRSVPRKAPGPRRPPKWPATRG